MKYGRNGIFPTPHFHAIHHWMDITKLQEYMAVINECPYIAENLHMTWDANKHCIQWRALEDVSSTLSPTPDLVTDPTHAPDTKTNKHPDQTFMTPEVFRELYLDVQGERDGDGTNHTNRFIHFFHDKINAIMRNWGNQIKTAEKRLEAHITRFDKSFQDIEDCFEKFRHTYMITMNKTSEDISAVNANVSFHLTCLQEHADTCISCINQALCWVDSQLNRLQQDYVQNIITKIEMTAKPVIEDTVATLAQQHLDSKAETLDHQATEILLNMEETYNNYLHQLKNCLPSH